MSAVLPPAVFTEPAVLPPAVLPTTKPTPDHYTAALNVQYRPLDTLIPYARNPRTHSDAQVAKIAASIAEFGWTNPILVDGANGVIAGHGRLAAARKLGLTEVPVIELGHLTATQKRAYVIADNRLALDAGWDAEMLAVELGELVDDGYDLAMTGFEDSELADLLGDDANSERTDPEDDAANDVPEPPVVAVTKTGDVWALGRHRLVCGSAGDDAAIAAVMQQDKAKLLFTSPPYANQRNYTTGGIADWDDLMCDVFATSMGAMADDGQMLVNLGLVHREGSVVRYWDNWLSWMPGCGWRFFGWYVWDQSVTVPGDWAGRLAPRHEFVFHFNRKARKPNKTVPCKYAGQDVHLRPDGSSSGGLRAKDGDRAAWTHLGQVTQDFRIPDSVITVTRQRGAIGDGIDHPAVFPIGLPEFVLGAYSNEGDIVFEPFCGSGTTVLAAERTGRVARAVEIAPEYVDVAIKRFEQTFHGVPVTLVGTGQTFAEVEAERLGAGAEREQAAA